MELYSNLKTEIVQLNLEKEKDFSIYMRYSLRIKDPNKMKVKGQVKMYYYGRRKKSKKERWEGGRRKQQEVLSEINIIL